MVISSKPTSSRCIESTPTSTQINRGFPWGASNTALGLLANIVETILKQLPLSPSRRQMASVIVATVRS